MSTVVRNPIRTVVAAVDLQATSREVVTAAAQVAGLAGSRLILLHVTEPPGPVRIPQELRKALVNRRSDEGARGLEIERKRIEATGTLAEARLVRGRPAHRTIVRETRSQGADLLVIGTHGRGREARLGSTADRLLRTSPVPCLLVRGRVRFPVRRVAAATDFSPQSAEALRVAADWIGILGEDTAHLDVIHVGEKAYRDLDPSLEELCEAILEGEVARVRKETDLDPDLVRLHLEWASHPVEGIVTGLKGGDHDLVVVGTRGYGRLRRTLLGGLTMGLAQRSPCPVLVVRDRPARLEPTAVGNAKHGVPHFLQERSPSAS